MMARRFRGFAMNTVRTLGTVALAVLAGCTTLPSTDGKEAKE